MQPFKDINAIAVPIPIANVDTDQIVPARFLWRKRGDGWGHLLFHDLRFNDDDTPRAGFVLNQVAVQGAGIIVADRNFGCGSSREHAVWSLYDYGIRALIAPSFGDIFYNNCFQNGVLAIALPDSDVQELLNALACTPGSRLTIDLASQTVTTANNGVLAFAIDDFRKSCLLSGADDIGFTLGLDGDIRRFERERERRHSWL
jgi:3-isopropylmalate/(R)-2-methylmalate dehydratase small subunit